MSLPKLTAHAGFQLYLLLTQGLLHVQRNVSALTSVYVFQGPSCSLYQTWHGGRLAELYTSTFVLLPNPVLALF